MNEDGYEYLNRLWTNEMENEDLQDLDDTKLSKAMEYLTMLRVDLAQTPSEQQLRAELLTAMIRNVEFMLNDLVSIRRDKILRDALENRRPTGAMTNAEEEFFGRLQRASAGHLEFAEEVLAGGSVRKSGSAGDDGTSCDTTTDYVTVRFIKPIDSAFVGVDGETYGPFKAEDIASVPYENVKHWLRNGTVTRVVLDSKEE
ncbi:MAG: hypothetical protein QXS20_01980 [Candidatus Thorarchaeota archaeon]